MGIIGSAQRLLRRFHSFFVKKGQLKRLKLRILFGKEKLNFENKVIFLCIKIFFLENKKLFKIRKISVDNYIL